MIELSTYSLRWDPSDICTTMRTSCLTKRVKANVHSLHLSWRQTRARRLCQKCASVYCIQCRQDSGSDCNFYLLLTRRNTHIQCNQVSAVKRLNASGRGLCLCLPLEAVFMQRLCPGDITWHPGSKWVIFWGLLHKCFFFYWWWGNFELWNLQDVLSIQRSLLCQKIKGNLVSHIMTPLTVMTNNRFILKILVQETLSNISER